MSPASTGDIAARGQKPMPPSPDRAAFLHEKPVEIMNATLANVIPPTTTRVEANTPDRWNEDIARETRERVACYRNAGPAALTRRIEELDREWDIERVLQTNAGMASLTGAVLALTVDRRFAWLSAAVGAFLLQHAVQGWCPPLPLLRRAGVRTAREIDEERIALKRLRGDFAETQGGSPEF